MAAVFYEKIIIVLDVIFPTIFLIFKSAIISNRCPDLGKFQKKYNRNMERNKLLAVTSQRKPINTRYVGAIHNYVGSHLAEIICKRSSYRLIKYHDASEKKESKSTSHRDFPFQKICDENAF